MLLAFSVLFIGCNKEEPEPEPEPEPPEIFEIVDQNFLDTLIGLGYDENEDRIIDSLEASKIEYLYINSCNISDLEGIQNFVNLRLLDCGSNHITRLDMSHNSLLEELYCNDNQLSRLIISGNPELRWLECSYNKLTTLNISGNMLLEYLDCNENDLSSMHMPDSAAPLI